MRTCRTGPELVSAFLPVGSVGNQGSYQLQNILFTVDIGERIVVVGLSEIDCIQNLDAVLVALQQFPSFQNDCTFRMSFVKIEKGNTRKNFSGLEIAVLHITLDKPLYLVLQRFPAGLTEMETDDIGGVVHLHGEAAVLLVVGLGGLGRVVAHLHTSIKMGDTPPDAFLCVILNDDSDDK